MTLPALSRRYKHWNDDEVEKAAQLIYNGTHWRDIQASLGRTRTGIKRALAKRSFLISELRQDYGGCRSIRAVAALMNVNHEVVTQWIANGELAPTTRRHHYRKHRFVSDDALMAFMADYRYWMDWHPNLVTEPDWRIYAQRCRDAVWGRWLTPNELAYILGWSSITVLRWIKKHQIPGVICRRDYYYIWSRALDGWPPLQGRRL